MARESIPSWYFALAIVRRDNEFLLVQERKHGGRWFLPGGRVEPGEDLMSGAQRETLEEAGIPIVLDGILRIEHTPMPTGETRVRVFFVAHPLDNRPPKDYADEESLGAAWVSLARLSDLPLRSPEVQDILNYVVNGAPIFPLKLIAREGAPFQ
jgi:phosphatase NudJ